LKRKRKKKNKQKQQNKRKKKKKQAEAAKQKQTKEKEKEKQIKEKEKAKLAKEKEKGKGKNTGTELEKPKKARTGYSFFFSENIASFRKQNPNEKMSDLMKVIGKSWNELAQDKKQKFQDMAAKDKERSKKDREAYKQAKPKKPLSSFMLFANDIRPKLRTENPTSKMTEIGKLIGAEWAKLSAAKKEEWKAKVVKAK